MAQSGCRPNRGETSEGSFKFRLMAPPLCMTASKRYRQLGSYHVPLPVILRGWLATQCSWPPALLVFPANRKFYREFCKFTTSSTPVCTEY
jgi:hypothetical protein